MALTLYYGSGSPYAWRVWLALAHKKIDFELKTMSFDSGALKQPAFLALNPRGRVPVLTDGDFALYESAAIIEYLEDRFPDAPQLFSSDPRQRALERRMVREADQYFAEPLERLVEAVLFTPKERWAPARIDAAFADIQRELAAWETMIQGDFLAGPLSAADYTLYPEWALVQRLAEHRARKFAPPGLMGPLMAAWAARMRALAIVQQTWPPHWV